jgi:16S rRNA (guanine966-N2)-methyltransferase
VIFELPGGMELAPPGWTCLKRLGGKGARQPSAAFFKKV